eukprot:TRINITY_DN1768_c0_g1_i2.p1 TRINITY_DN1768_c0_g1~~TRINITY_DN1768_c0_g1_i2.p1  ORF type:complete len:864 (+),score=292.87 TRINITY_DN1768_c0_g1_i2:62-2653(+)
MSDPKCRSPQQVTDGAHLDAKGKRRVARNERRNDDATHNGSNVPNFPAILTLLPPHTLQHSPRSNTTATTITTAEHHCSCSSTHSSNSSNSDCSPTSSSSGSPASPRSPITPKTHSTQIKQDTSTHQPSNPHTHPHTHTRFHSQIHENTKEFSSSNPISDEGESHRRRSFTLMTSKEAESLPPLHGSSQNNNDDYDDVRNQGNTISPLSASINNKKRLRVKEAIGSSNFPPFQPSPTVSTSLSVSTPLPPTLFVSTPQQQPSTSASPFDHHQPPPAPLLASLSSSPTKSQQIPSNKNKTKASRDRALDASVVPAPVPAPVPLLSGLGVKNNKLQSQEKENEKDFDHHIDDDQYNQSFEEEDDEEEEVEEEEENERKPEKNSTPSNNNTTSPPTIGFSSLTPGQNILVFTQGGQGKSSSPHLNSSPTANFFQNIGLSVNPITNTITIFHSNKTPPTSQTSLQTPQAPSPSTNTPTPNNVNPILPQSSADINSMILRKRIAQPPPLSDEIRPMSSSNMSQSTMDDSLIGDSEIDETEAAAVNLFFGSGEHGDILRYHDAPNKEAPESRCQTSGGMSTELEGMDPDFIDYLTQQAPTSDIATKIHTLKERKNKEQAKQQNQPQQQFQQSPQQSQSQLQPPKKQDNKMDKELPSPSLKDKHSTKLNEKVNQQIQQEVNLSLPPGLVRSEKAKSKSSHGSDTVSVDSSKTSKSAKSLKTNLSIKSKATTDSSNSAKTDLNVKSKRQQQHSVLNTPQFIGRQRGSPTTVAQDKQEKRTQPDIGSPIKGNVPRAAAAVATTTTGTSPTKTLKPPQFFSLPPEPETLPSHRPHSKTAQETITQQQIEGGEELEPLESPGTTEANSVICCIM